MKEIKLTQGKVAIVDDSMFDYLNQYRWYAICTKGCWYARRYQKIQKKQYVKIQMHREILGLKFGDGKLTDHKNRNGLDNRLGNLRICSKIENCYNRRKRRIKYNSKYIGVSLEKRFKNLKWYAGIWHNYKYFYLGCFDNEIEAAKAYDRKAKELFGEFANLNFLIERVA